MEKREARIRSKRAMRSLWSRFGGGAVLGGGNGAVIVVLLVFVTCFLDG